MRSKGGNPVSPGNVSGEIHRIISIATAVLGTLASPVGAYAQPAANLASPQARERGLQSLIVSGQPTSSYPAIGALLLYEDAAGSTFYGACSGTLIGCHTFLTAAHCVCPDSASDAAACERAGTTDPATLRVFLQHAGILPVAAVAISPDYRFAVSSDLAILTLAEPATGIAPHATNTLQRPGLGAAGTIVGFGTTASGRGSTDDSGIKRTGAVTTGVCPADIASEAHVCWEFGGSGANSCQGDSGGPLLMDFGFGPVLAGVTSGGHSVSCLAPDSAFDADVFANRSWIAATAGSDLGIESCDLPAVGTALTTTFAGDGTLAAGSAEARLQFAVPEATAVLRVGLNAQIGSGAGFDRTQNDFDVFVRAGNDPTAQVFDCADTSPTAFGACEITAPRPGIWHVLVTLNRGAGAFQVTATTFAAAATPPCTGDCNNDSAVTIDEMVTGVTIALSGADLGTCDALDANGDGTVTIDELVAAVTNALDGCPRL